MPLRATYTKLEHLFGSDVEDRAAVVERAVGLNFQFNHSEGFIVLEAVDVHEPS